MRRNLLLLAVGFLAAPLSAAEPPQVELHVTVLSGPAAMLERAEVKDLLPKRASQGQTAQRVGVMSADEATSLVRACRKHGGAKVLAEPKLVTLSGRPASFLSGGQQAVTSATQAEAIEFRHFGTQIDFLPIVEPDSDKLHLECAVTISRRAANDGIDEKCIKTALELKPGQVAIVCEPGLPAKSDFGPPVLSKIPYLRRPSGKPIESECLLVFVSPRLIAPQVSAPATAVKSAVEQRAAAVAAKLVAKYHDACAKGEAELAREFAQMALDLDPGCFAAAKTEAKAASSTSGQEPPPEWRKCWMNDQPSHLTPERVHGGIQ